MASPQRRQELDIDPATDELMRRVYECLRTEGRPLSVAQLEEIMDLPSVRTRFGVEDYGAHRSSNRLSVALETLVLVKAVETGPAEDGPSYLARPGVDTQEWHAPDSR